MHYCVVLLEVILTGDRKLVYCNEERKGRREGGRGRGKTDRQAHRDREVRTKEGQRETKQREREEM